MSRIIEDPGRQEAINEAYAAGRRVGFSEGKADRRRWKRIARRLKSKYKHKYEIELAKKQATQEAMVAMIQQLADAVQGQIEIIDGEWVQAEEKKKGGAGN